MKIKALNGQEAEAFDLIIRKKFALDIIGEKKAVEYRDYKLHYLRRFFNNLKTLEEKPINVVHFHDYNNSFFLDVQITQACAGYLDNDAIALLEKYHELQMVEVCKKNTTLADDDKPIVCMLPIVGIINTNLVSLSVLASNRFIPLQDDIKPFGFHLKDDWHRTRWHEAYHLR